eukprot:CAMPEP_0172677914 /NCGR_PEP_ID=MMETSP1074-20121228/15009_1 /TAXON_ID=2916 /ORGANISM="Ceratium fusus, Strain PA161109" /LENGTH=109 /DNA_ID=CAMNT_0013495833 /DNA_START=305 /DNA_END=634 /DNA_ORIENTATION=-
MKWWTKEQGSLLNCPICRETQRVSAKKVRQVDFEVRQKQQQEQRQKPSTRFLRSLRAALLQKSVRPSSSDATATASNGLLGPSQAASQMSHAEAAHRQGSDLSGAQTAQ